MSAVFKEFTPAKTANFLKRLDGLRGGGKNTCDLSSGFIRHFDARATKILGQNLSFADGWMRVDCEDYTAMPHRKQIFLANDKNILPFIYSPDPLGDLLAPLDIDINEKTVMDYLIVYFLAFVKNGEKIIPVFHADDIQWQDDLTPLLRKSLEKDFARYPQIKNDGENILATFSCLFQTSLLEITCLVLRDGRVEIKNRIVQLDDLPVKNFP